MRAFPDALEYLPQIQHKKIKMTALLEK